MLRNVTKLVLERTGDENWKEDLKNAYQKYIEAQHKVRDRVIEVMNNFRFYEYLGQEDIDKITSNIIKDIIRTP